MKKVSIIIVTYNSEKDIYDCVASIQKFTDIPREELELIIVDNNSRNADEMFSKLKEQYGSDIILIHNTHNGGYGQGNNVGIRRASAPIVLIMNPDVRLACPFFRRPLERFKQDSKLLIYGMKQMYTPTLESRSSFCCTYMMNGYVRTMLEGLCNRIDWYIPKLQYIQGSCFFIRKEPFSDIGLFDESVFMYGEEDDIHYRLMHRFGANFHYDKSMCYLHLTSEREPDVEYEMKFVKVAIQQNLKKGYSQQKTLLNMLRLYRVLYWREYLRVCLGKDKKRYLMLQHMISNIKALRQTI